MNKYLSITFTAHAIHDIESFDSEEDARNYILKIISKNTGCKESDVINTFGEWNTKIENGLNWYINDIDKNFNQMLINDRTVLSDSEFYYTPIINGENKNNEICEDFGSAIIEVTPYDKAFSIKIGTVDGVLIYVNQGGYVTFKDAKDCCKDELNDIKDVTDSNEHNFHYDETRNKLEISIETDTSEEYYREIIIDTANINSCLDYNTKEDTKEETKVAEHVLTPKEISAKAAEDQEIRRVLQHDEYETQKTLHELLGKFNKEQHKKFLEMALVLAKGLAADVETNIKTTENNIDNVADNVSTINNNVTQQSTINNPVNVSTTNNQQVNYCSNFFDDNFDVALWKPFREDFETKKMYDESLAELLKVKPTDPNYHEWDLMRKEIGTSTYEEFIHNEFSAGYPEEIDITSDSEGFIDNQGNFVKPGTPLVDCMDSTYRWINPNYAFAPQHMKMYCLGGCDSAVLAAFTASIVVDADTNEIIYAIADQD